MQIVCMYIYLYGRILCFLLRILRVEHEPVGMQVAVGHARRQSMALQGVWP